MTYVKWIETPGINSGFHIYATIAKVIMPKTTAPVMVQSFAIGFLIKAKAKTRSDNAIKYIAAGKMQFIFRV